MLDILYWVCGISVFLVLITSFANMESLMFCLILISASSIVGIVVLSINQEHIYLKNHHCVETGNYDVSYITTYTTVGNVLIPSLTPVTSYEYTCDNGTHWS